MVRGAAYTLLGEVAKAQADFEAAIRLSPKQAAPGSSWRFRIISKGNSLRWPMNCLGYSVGSE